MEKTVCVYIADISNVNEDDLFNKYASSFSKERLERINKKPCEKTRKELITAGAVLSYALSLKGIKEAEFIYKENKKPYLKDNDDLFFNISHSGDFVGVAVSGVDIGFDIQKPVDKVGDATKSRVLTEDEKKLIDKEEITFNEIWCVKESYSKLTGIGIAENFTDITYKKTSDNRFVLYKNKKEEANGEVIELPNGYKASLCVNDSLDKIDVVFVDL